LSHEEGNNTANVRVT